jgi:antitoxin component YwqK of YwqJK toxin-antitoxin module
MFVYFQILNFKSKGLFYISSIFAIIGLSALLFNYEDTHRELDPLEEKENSEVNLSSLHTENNVSYARFTGSASSKYKNGVKESEIHFKDGVEHGKSIMRYESGQKKSETEYVDGVLQGKFTGWYENGTVNYEGTFLDGREVGPYVNFYPNGTKSWEANYEKDGTKSLQVNWYENGGKCSEETFLDGKIISAVSWLPNGEKCPVTEVLEGTGTWVYYSESGRKQQEGHYVEGFKDGNWTYLNPESRKYFTFTWKKGVLAR